MGSYDTPNNFVSGSARIHPAILACASIRCFREVSDAALADLLRSGILSPALDREAPLPERRGLASLADVLT